MSVVSVGSSSESQPSWNHPGYLQNIIDGNESNKRNISQTYSRISVSDSWPSSKWSGGIGYENPVDFVLKRMTPVDRLHYRKKTRITLIQDKIKQPDGSLPNGKLPSWKKLNLSDKIPAPRIHNHSFVFSRGGICQNIQRHVKSYLLDDPYNKQRVICDSYNALHDPSTRSYFQNPKVQKQLIEQGLITPAGKVVCSLTQFNNWRSYLNNTVYNEEVKKTLSKFDATKKDNHEQRKRIDNFNSHQSILSRHYRRIQRYNKAKEIKRKHQNEEHKKFNERQRVKEEQCNRYLLKVTRKQLDSIFRATEQQNKQMCNLTLVHQSQISARKKAIRRIQEKERDARIRKEVQEQFAIARNERQYMDSLHPQCQRQEAENIREVIIEDFLRKESRIAAAIRHKRVQRLRAKLPELVEQGKEFQHRMNYLARKYIRKWANYTINLQLRRCLHPHMSMFQLSTALGETVEFLANSVGVQRSSSAPPLISKSDRSIGSSEETLMMKTEKFYRGQQLINDTKIMSTGRTKLKSEPIIIRGKVPKTRGIMKKVGSVVKKTSSKPICTAELKRTANIFVEETVELLLTEARGVCHEVAKEKQNGSKLKSSRMTTARPSAAGDGLDIENLPMRNQKLISINNNNSTPKIELKRLIHIDESIPVISDSTTKHGERHKKPNNTDLQKLPIIYSNIVDSEPRPRLRQSLAYTTTDIETEENERSDTEYLYEIAQQTRVALETTTSVTSLLGQSTTISENLAEDTTKLIGLQTEVLEGVIDKQSLFTSSASYSEFADQVYEEMTSYVVASEESGEVTKLIEKKINENNMEILKNDFFKTLLKLCVSEDDVKLINRLKKPYVPKSSRPKSRASGNSRNVTTNRSKIVPNTSSSAQKLHPKFFRKKSYSARSPIQFFKSIPTMSMENNSIIRTNDLPRSISAGEASTSIVNNNTQVKKQITTNSVFTITSEGTGSDYLQPSLRTCSAPSADSKFIPLEVKMGPYHGDNESNIFNEKEPEVNNLNKMTEMIVQKNKSKVYNSTLFNSIESSSSSNGDDQQNNTISPKSSKSSQESLNLCSEDSKSSTTTTEINNNSKGPRISVQPLKPTLGRLVPNYKFSELSLLDPFNMASQTDIQKYQSVQPPRFKLPFLSPKVSDDEDRHVLASGVPKLPEIVTKLEESDVVQIKSQTSSTTSTPKLPKICVSTAPVSLALSSLAPSTLAPPLLAPPSLAPSRLAPPSLVPSRLAPSTVSNVRKSASLSNILKLPCLVTLFKKEPIESFKSDDTEIEIGTINSDLEVKSSNVSEYSLDSTSLANTSLANERIEILPEMKEVNEILEFLGVIIHHRVVQDVIKILMDMGERSSEKFSPDLVDKMYRVTLKNIVRLTLQLHNVQRNHKNWRIIPSALGYYKNSLDRLTECISAMIIADLE